MRKKIVFTLVLFPLFTFPVFAQTAGEGFFDKYLPIAKLFDSPLFFGIVVGSGALFLLWSFFFLRYVKRLEKQSYEWGENMKPEELVELLDSPIPSEKRHAFIYLRNHGKDQEISIILDKLNDQRKKGQVNPTLIHLLEDMGATEAVPLLQTISKGKSQIASIAALALERIPFTEEEKASAKG